jgi:DNA-binding response OmpR family regulator
MAKVLIIDDSPSVVRKVRTVLEPAGHEVDSVEMIVHLAEKLREDPPDLILLDLTMPALSGSKVASLIHRFQQRPTPLIIYSSRPTVELRSTAAEVGANAWVQKGDPDCRLLAVVDNFSCSDHVKVA